MTEDQILQRVAESQKRVFSDIDNSKQYGSTGGMQIIGGNGINIQQQRGQAAISIDPSAASGLGEQGKQGKQGEQGEQGEQGWRGDPGSKITGITVTGNLSFTFTFDDGTEITTDPLLSGSGLMYFDGTNIATIQSAGNLSVLGSGGGGQPYWIATEACN